MTLTQLALSVLLGAAQPQHHAAEPQPYRTATVTSYCSRCSGPVDQCGEPLRTGTVAADTWLHIGKAPAGALHVNGSRWRWYWVGDRIQFGSPIRATLTVRDCGGAIRGRDRFDLCRGTVAACRCDAWGKQALQYRVVGR